MLPAMPPSAGCTHCCDCYSTATATTSTGSSAACTYPPLVCLSARIKSQLEHGMGRPHPFSARLFRALTHARGTGRHETCDRVLGSCFQSSTSSPVLSPHDTACRGFQQINVGRRHHPAQPSLRDQDVWQCPHAHLRRLLVMHPKAVGEWSLLGFS